MARGDATTDQKIMAMVKRELKKNPKVSVADLQEKAKSISSAAGSLTRRQFHARYPLQVKRRQKSADAGSETVKRATKPRSTRVTKKVSKPRRSPAATAKKTAKARTSRKTTARETTARASASSSSPSVNRDAVRDAFLGFASDLAAAEARKDVVKVLAGVDKYVNQVVKAVG